MESGICVSRVLRPARSCDSVDCISATVQYTTGSSWCCIGSRWSPWKRMAQGLLLLLLLLYVIAAQLLAATTRVTTMTSSRCLDSLSSSLGGV